MSDTPTLADSPFDQLSADIILRSADHVDFHAHRVILAQASPFFADMFSLPSDPHPTRVHSGCRDVEDSKTLHRLLLLCYPVDKQELESVIDIAPVLAAARKFDMEWPVRLLTRDLADSISRSPLHVWSCACRSGLEDVARLAAAEIKRRVSSKVGKTEDPDPSIALLLRCALLGGGRATDVLQGQGTYTLDAPYTAVVDILALCYRGKSDASSCTDVEGIARALAACGGPVDAQMLDAPRQLWEQCVEIDPLGAYLAAAKQGLGKRTSERRHARPSHPSPWILHGRLEHAEATVYERLLKYHHDASVAVVDVLTYVGEKWGSTMLGTRRLKDATRKLSLGQHAPGMTLEAMGIDTATLTEGALQQWGTGFHDGVRKALKEVESTLQPRIRNVLNVSRLAL
ncbi:uncharacterized protein BXZ73DRAFT_97897 [Epithele typhae]|uniref:uncharacterized protein n=1 Tax=Epithele typhae TaxID=378194 RepID=UPI002008007B|nr:uncharacterized protein BXZ73DRAFT_97897 [Epithele typhae]KAH9942487.1 hypothetical protein BXZ73DRAFT_97897 [Epithele typhae]